MRTYARSQGDSVASWQLKMHESIILLTICSMVLLFSLSRYSGSNCMESNVELHQSSKFEISLHLE